MQLSINVEICLKICIGFYYFILKQSDVDVKLDASKKNLSSPRGLSLEKNSIFSSNLLDCFCSIPLVTEPWLAPGSAPFLFVNLSKTELFLHGNNQELKKSRSGARSYSCLTLGTCHRESNSWFFLGRWWGPRW